MNLKKKIMILMMSVAVSMAQASSLFNQARVALINNDMPQFVQLLKVLPVQEVDNFDEQGTNLLQLAIMADRPLAVQQLIRKGADVNAIDAQGDSVLLLAVQNYSQFSTFNLLLQAGADPRLLNMQRKNALHVAQAIVNDVESDPLYQDQNIEIYTMLRQQADMFDQQDRHRAQELQRQRHLQRGQQLARDIRAKKKQEADKIAYSNYDLIADKESEADKVAYLNFDLN